jgi:hypothetical protein
VPRYLKTQDDTYSSALLLLLRQSACTLQHAHSFSSSALAQLVEALKLCRSDCVVVVMGTVCCTLCVQYPQRFVSAAQQ